MCRSELTNKVLSLETNINNNNINCIKYSMPVNFISFQKQQWLEMKGSEIKNDYNMSL